MKGLSLSFCLLFVGVLNAQKQTRITRLNQHAEVIQYTTRACYSRAILVEGDKVYLGNSNGALYVYNLVSMESIDIMDSKNFQEMRDIVLCSGSLLGMQSGTDGLLVQTDGETFEKFIHAKGDLWIGTFLDGMDFHNNIGFMMGDAQKGFFKLFKTEDCGATWNPCEGKVAAMEGEGGFAASGTNVQVLNDSTFMFVTGGSVSRFIKSTDGGKTWSSTSIPFHSGKGSGAFSFHFINELEGIVVGGDYENPELVKNNSYFTNDGGEFWTNSKEQVFGYRSCVIEVNGIAYACGTTGIDFSKDKGNTWEPFAYGNYFALACDGQKLYATMQKGSFQRFNLIHY